MAATDAKYIPIRNQAFRYYFPGYNTSGKSALLVVDSGLASGGGKAALSKNGGAAVNSTNSVTLAGASSGLYFVDLTAAEMDAEAIGIAIFTGAGTQDHIVNLYTEPRGIRDLAFPATSGRSLAVDTSGRVTVEGLAANAINAAAIAADAITAAKIAPDAFGASELAADAVTEIAAGVLAAFNSTPPAVSLANGAITAATIAANAITNAALAADTIGASELAADAATEIAAAVWAIAMAEVAGVPATNASVKQGLEWLFAVSRNKRTQTATAEVIRNDADSATIATSTKADDGTTFTRGKFV